MIAYDRLIYWARKALEENRQDCVLWDRGKDSDGYPFAKKNGRMYKGHRVVCEAIHGDSPRGKTLVAHRCGKRACVNPNHLYWATPQENSMDRVVHGNTQKGSLNVFSVLDEAQVAQILDERALGAPIEVLAAKYGISCGWVLSIVRRKTWAQVAHTYIERYVVRPLYENEAKEILLAHRTENLSVRALMAKFNRSKSCVSKLIARKTWRHLD